LLVRLDIVWRPGFNLAPGVYIYIYGLSLGMRVDARSPVAASLTGVLDLVECQTSLAIQN